MRRFASLKQIVGTKSMIDLAGTLAFPKESISKEVKSTNPSAIKMVATIGPASANPQVLRSMFKNGVNVCRLNFSHGSHAYYTKIIEMIRSVAKEEGVENSLAIALDTKGPEIRTAANQDDQPLYYSTGQLVTVRAITHGEERNTKDTLYISYQKGVTTATVGGSILLADGQCVLRIKEIKSSDELLCVADVADLSLSGKNNVHLPGISIDLESLSAKDKADIAFGMKCGIDMVFASFARSGEHIQAIRNEIQLHDSASDIAVPVIAKIENEEGISNINDIIDNSDGIMIARGDLGVELPVESLFLAQKTLSAHTFIKAKPIICATQMLESMTVHNRPTRAEASDVANAVIDGADCVMLSGETAAGHHPVEATNVMKRIAARADSYSATLANFKRTLEVCNEERSTIIGSIASAAVLASFELDASFIVTTTVSGNSVRQLAKFRPQCPIIVMCRQRRTARSLSITRGVVPVLCDDITTDKWESSFPELIERGIEYGKRYIDSQQLPTGKRPMVIVTNTDMRPYNRCSMTIRVL